MSEIGDVFSALREHKKEKKLDNKAYSTEALRKAGIEFVSKNEGLHLMVIGKVGFIDFWPSTGKWKCRTSGKYLRGIKSLIKYIDIS